MKTRKGKEISAADFLPKKLTIPSLRKAAKVCRGCHLYKYATQTVFGEGSEKAKLMVIGEIPGDKEDLEGKPFVGPAGKFLRKILEESNLHDEDIYFTNVVKHFKFTYRNQRRLHRSPIGAEIRACKPWLNAEIEVVQPKVIMCLGVTAAKSLIPGKVTITGHRGKWLEFNEQIKLFITFHPSAILRASTDEDRHRMKKIFQQDIKKVALFLTKKR